MCAGVTPVGGPVVSACFGGGRDGHFRDGSRAVYRPGNIPHSIAATSTLGMVRGGKLSHRAVAKVCRATSIYEGDDGMEYSTNTFPSFPLEP